MEPCMIKISPAQKKIISGALRSFYAAPLFGLMVDTDPSTADELPLLIDMMDMLDCRSDPDLIVDFTA